MHLRLRTVFVATLMAASLALGSEAGVPTVHVIHAPAWSQGDAVREGAAEFVILMEVARVSRAATRGGLVGVGDRRGLFGPGAEQAMEQAALRGVPVVKLAPNGRVLPAPHGLFLDGCGLSEQEATAILTRCLVIHGALPVVTDAANDARNAELRTRLQLYQQEFTLAAASRLAAR